MKFLKELYIKRLIEKYKRVGAQYGSALYLVGIIGRGNKDFQKLEEKFIKLEDKIRKAGYEPYKLDRFIDKSEDNKELPALKKVS